MSETVASLEFFSHVIASAQDAIIGETVDGIIASWNAGAVRLFGYSRGEMLGVSSSIITLPPRSHEFQRAIGLIREGGRVPIFEERFRCKDGEMILGSVSLSPVVDGADQLIGISRIVRLAGGLSGPFDPDLFPNGRPYDAGLRQSNRLEAMSQMVISLAHELDQPLTAIAVYLSSARSLLSGDNPNISEMVATAVDRASKQTSRAAALIRSLRLFVSPEHGDMELKSVRATIKEASDLILIAAREADVDVKFQLDDDGMLPLHGLQIQQVVINLARNAIDAMRAGPCRELRISTALGDDHIVVTVADTGPGLPKFATRLFQPFMTSKPNGMGVGLSICHSIIKAHGGRIWLDASVARGTTFHFELPFVQPPTSL